MTDREIDIVIGSLLHDVGKVIYRAGEERKKHSQSGYEFLKDTVEIEIPDILDAVRYHHADSLKNAKIEKNSIAYITYIADNISSAADRRTREAEDVGFEVSAPLESVFNILNCNNQRLYYSPDMLNPKGDFNYPSKEKKDFDKYFYKTVKENLTDNLKGLQWRSPEYINSLLEVLEANLTYVPSSTAKGEMADISLFDHVKLTAAIASCITGYLDETGQNDYHELLFKKGNEFYSVDAFCLYSMDISGIQDFIYTITSENALKTLRARSFYLEIMMEHMTDCLLQELHLSRANLIYSGGGHCYILMPNTQKAKDIVEAYMKKLNHWLRKNFQISLYVAWGYTACSANSLKNKPEGSYSEIFRKVSEMISGKKSHRYTAEDILELNGKQHEDYTRECKVCKNIAKVNQDGICPVCKAIEKFSGNILYDQFFTVTLEKLEDALPLPGGYFLITDREDTLRKRMQEDKYFVRVYSKNQMFTGKQIATKIWVGDYTSGKTFKEYAREAEGIDRIAILRADVDNLGHAFVAGFENPKNSNRYVTLSRTATLSRQLSLFFKLQINKLLEEGTYSISSGKDKHPRNVSICYSGGDDLFIVGAWEEVVEFSIDIRRAFEKYTEGMLSLSAGIGLYEEGYPISASAAEVASLENAAKKMPEKNAVALFEGKEGTYHWKEFEDKVLGEKYKVLYEFFQVSENRGKNFLYNLLELIRNRKEKINFARYVYILSRLEPEKEEPEVQKEAYRKFSEKMYLWIKDDEDCRQLVTAIYLYIYLTRQEEDMDYERK